MTASSYALSMTVRAKSYKSLGKCMTDEVIMHASVERCKMYSMHHVKTTSVLVHDKTHSACNGKYNKGSFTTINIFQSIQRHDKKKCETNFTSVNDG